MEPQGAPDVHVWTTTLESFPLGVGALADLLSPDERERAARMLIPSHRDTFVLARGTLRRLAGAYLDLPPGRLRFDYTALGRPVLPAADNPDGLEFSVSHSGGVVLLAFARGVAVGVDVERIRPRVDCDAIAERFFAPVERQSLASMGGSERRTAFFTCWTRKEAVLKAVGLGISRGLARVAVTCEPGVQARIVASDLGEISPDAWSLRDLDAGPGYIAALAVQAPGLHLRRLRDAAGIVPPRLSDVESHQSGVVKPCIPRGGQ